MIGKNDVLKKMEAIDGNGRRAPFSIAFITADRAAWEKKKRLIKEQHLLAQTDDGWQKIEGQIKSLKLGEDLLPIKNEKWQKKQELILCQENISKSVFPSEWEEFQKRIDALDTGGRIIEHGNCVLSGKRGIHGKKEAVCSGQLAGAAEEESWQKEESWQMAGGSGQEARRKLAGKAPNHWRNRTRNVLFQPSGQIRKCHISLIVSFNGEEVIY